MLSILTETTLFFYYVWSIYDCCVINMDYLLCEMDARIISIQELNM